MDFKNIIDRFQDEELLGNLSKEDSKTFVELLLLAVFADGEVTEEELHGLNEQWTQLPFANVPEMEEEVGEHGFEFRSRIEESLGDEDAFDALLEESANKLLLDEKREAALRMVAIVTHSDGLDTSEIELANRLGELFNFDQDRIDAIVQDIFDAPVPEEA